MVTCAGSPVSLLRLSGDADAESVREALARSLLARSELASMADDPTAIRTDDPLLATAVCDVDGRFAFDDVPYGTYGVQTHVEWLVGDEDQGGSVYAIFEISQEQPIGRPQAILSLTD